MAHLLQPVFGPIVNGWGSSATVYIGPGSLLGMAGTQFTQNFIPNYDSTLWVHGHILNRHLGGNGEAKNLVPLTNKANAQHKTWETYIKSNLMTVINAINRQEVGSTKYNYVDINRYTYFIWYSVDVSTVLLKATYPGVPVNNPAQLPPQSIKIAYDIKRLEITTGNITNLTTNEYEYITRRYGDNLTKRMSGFDTIYNTH